VVYSIINLFLMLAIIHILMRKLLFIAGEPGAGKTEEVARSLSESNIGLVLHSDRISGQASKYYPSGKPLQNRWQLWKLEFDQASNSAALGHAYSRAVDELYGIDLKETKRLIIEGVLAGHPEFRRTVMGILAALDFNVGQELTLALCPSWEQIQLNLKKRGRVKDQDLSFVEERRMDYKRRLDEQPDLVRCKSTEECCEVAMRYFIHNSE
jgi:hypothetical protein